MPINKRKSGFLIDSLKALTLLFVLCIVFFIFAHYSLLISKNSDIATSVFYIPAGLAVCSLLMFGQKYIPVIFMAQFLTFTYVGEFNFTRALVLSGASVAEAYMAWYLYKSFKNPIDEFFPYQSTLVLVSLMALVSAMIPSIIGVTSLYYQGFVTEQNFFTNFVNWYVGDILSLLIFIPVVISFKYEKHRILDFIFPFIALICFSFFKFEVMSPLLFLLFFLLLIPCCLGSIMGIYYTSIALVMALNWLFIQYLGPFSAGSSSDNIVDLQILLASIAITALTLEGFRKTQLLKNLFISISLMWLLTGSAFYFYFHQKLSNDRVVFAKLRDDFEININDRILLIENTLLGATGFIEGSVNVDSNEWNNYINSFNNTLKDKGVLGIGLSSVDHKTYLFNSSFMTIENFKSLIQNDYFKNTLNFSLIKNKPVLSPFVDINGKKISLFIKSISKKNQTVGWAIIPIELNSFFKSITDNRFSNIDIDIDIYESSDLGEKNLIFSKVVDPNMRNKMHSDTKRLSSISFFDRTFYVDWNNTLRFSTRSHTKAFLFLLIGSLLSLVVTGSYLRLNLSIFYSRENSKQNNIDNMESAIKYKILFDEEIEPIVLFDENKLIDCNKSALKLFKQKTKEDLLSLSINSLFDLHSFSSDESASALKFTILKQIKEMRDDTFFEKDTYILIRSMPFPANIHVSKLLIDNHIIYKAKIKEISHYSKKDLTMKQEFVERIISKQGEITQNLVTIDDNVTNTFNGSVFENKKNPPEVIMKTGDALPFQGQKILLVEDNQVNVIVTNKFLEKWGLSVEVASNGLDAISKVKENNFSLILMDIHMPVMDGIEATKEIRKFNKTTPIIGLSADVMSLESKHILSLGMNDFISKPFNSSSFKEILLKYIPSF